MTVGSRSLPKKRANKERVMSEERSVVPMLTEYERATAVAHAELILHIKNKLLNSKVQNGRFYSPDKLLTKIRRIKL